MSVLAALLLAAAPSVPATDAPVTPRQGVSVTARASVEILRAERVGGAPEPRRVERRERQTDKGLVVEFL